MRRILSTWVGGGLLLAGAIAAPALAIDPPGALPTSTQRHSELKTDNNDGKPEPRPDNTAKNAETRPTADQQSNAKDDVALTTQIRRAIVADKHLSVAARNVKVIARSGVVTLKGPVRSVEERAVVGDKASKIAGPERVKNELDVAP